MTPDPLEHLPLSESDRRELAGRDRSLLEQPADGLRSESAIATIEQSDRKIGKQLRDIAVPRSLKQRMLAQVGVVERQRRSAHRLRRFAVAMTTAAAASLLLLFARPMIRPEIDSDRVARKSAEIYSLIEGERAELEPVLVRNYWPTAVYSRTCVGSRTVTLFGRPARAYQLVSGRSRAVLIVMPKDEFPYRIGNESQILSESTRGVRVHCFPSDDLVCLLIVPHGSDERDFQSPQSFT